jgi:hypothetical protein
MALKLLEIDKCSNGNMWQAYTESELYHKDSRNITSFPIALWVADYLDSADPKEITLTISRKDMRKLAKMIKKAKNG